MRTTSFGAAALAAVAVAATLTGCSSSSDGSQAVSFAPVVGDQFTGNPSAPQTGGVPVPPSGVTMIGDAVAAQAVANNGLQQGTITSTSNDTTVYYPPAPTVPGLVVPAAETQAPPAPMQRPADQKPWGYTGEVLTAYQQICNTGTWRGYRAPEDVQAQTCWSLYGRQLGVRPWYPGDRDRPWEHADYPRPWWDRGWHPDTPVMWVYPPDWHRPKPQPIINVSITININGNPQAKPDPRDRVPYYPIWGVTPGAAVEVKGQAYVAPPLLPYFTVSASAGVYTPPVFPGVVLPPMRRDARDGGSTALPGQQVVGNVNTVPNIVTPLFVTGTGRSARLGQIADPSAVAAAGGRKAPGVVDLPGTLFGSSTPDAATTSTTTSGAKDSVGASKSAVETSQSKKAESGKPATKTSGAGKGTTGDGGPASTVSTSAETTTPARGTTTKATATEPPETTSKAQEPTKTVTPPVISVPVITAPPTTVAPTTVAPTTAAPETTTTARVKPGAGSSGGTDLCVPGTRHCLKN